MSSFGKDNAPTVEEILASIRRLAEPEVTTTSPPETISHEDVNGIDAVLFDDEDFELPAMFRSLSPSRVGQSAQPPQKVLDTQQPHYTERVVGHSRDSHVNARIANAAQSQAKLDGPGESVPYATEAWFEMLRTAIPSLEAIEGGIDAAPHHVGLDRPTAITAPPAESIPRRMDSCKDTLVGRMGQSQRQPEHAAGDESLPFPQIPAPATTYLPDVPVELRSAYGMPSHAQIAPLISDVEPPADPQPGRSEPNFDMHNSVGIGPSIEFLRPFIREWIDGNMRPIFEAALNQELKAKMKRADVAASQDVRADEAGQDKLGLKA